MDPCSTADAKAPYNYYSRSPLVVFEISILIPTYNRRKSLEAVLASIGLQRFPQDQLEVIVVDDGSKDDTAIIGQRQYPFRVKYICQANQGAAVARNRAVEEAQGKIFQFLDDDITLNDEYLQQTALAHQKFEKLVLVGNLQAVVHPNQTPFQEIYTHETSTPPAADGVNLQEVSYTDCLTGMFSVKRDHYFEIGRLRDLVGDGRVAWGDVDFGYRAHRLGFHIMRCYQAVGNHDDFSIQDLSTYARRWQRTSQSVVKLLEVFPEIRPSLAMLTDKFPISWKADPPGLIARKIFRKIASATINVLILEKITQLAEKAFPSKKLLSILYRWITGAYIYRGLQTGLRQAAQK